MMRRKRKRKSITLFCILLFDGWFYAFDFHLKTIERQSFAEENCNLCSLESLNYVTVLFLILYDVFDF